MKMLPAINPGGQPDVVQAGRRRAWERARRSTPQYVIQSAALREVILGLEAPPRLVIESYDAPTGKSNLRYVARFISFGLGGKYMDVTMAPAVRIMDLTTQKINR